MAERQPSRAQPVTARKRPAKAGKSDVVPQADAASGAFGRGPASTDDLASKIKALEDEREQLRFELDTARERIAALESANRAVLDRIAGVIRSLHSLPKDQ